MRRSRAESGPKVSANDHHSCAETFVTTHWTRVLQARGESTDAKAALSDLCAAYYQPVFAFIRRNSPNEDAARDLTQEFFTRLLEGGSIVNVDPQHGRFRSYLLGAAKHFLADARERANRLKRGGGEVPVPLEPATDTSPGLEVPDLNAPAPDREFDRPWALTLLARALESLAAQQKASGTLQQFEVLKVWLTGDTGKYFSSRSCPGSQHERRRHQGCRSPASTPVSSGDQKRDRTDRKRPQPGGTGDEALTRGASIKIKQSYFQSRVLPPLPLLQTSPFSSSSPLPPPPPPSLPLSPPLLLLPPLLPPPSSLLSSSLSPLPLSAFQQ